MILCIHNISLVITGSYDKTNKHFFHLYAVINNLNVDELFENLQKNFGFFPTPLQNHPQIWHKLYTTICHFIYYNIIFNYPHKVS